MQIFADLSLVTADELRIRAPCDKIADYEISVAAGELPAPAARPVARSAAASLPFGMGSLVEPKRRCKKEPTAERAMDPPQEEPSKPSRLKQLKKNRKAEALFCSKCSHVRLLCV